MKIPFFDCNISALARYSGAFCLVLSAIIVPVYQASAQKASTSSPYSRFGLGELRGSQLPQTRAMGGIASGVRHIGMYSNINAENPASYSAIQFTTIDVGVLGNLSELSNASRSENAYNFALSHIQFAFPLGKAGGLSVGLRPFSDVGYNYAVADRIDTVSLNKVYAGEGGTNAAYLGYGVRLNEHFSVGVNANYIFGSLTQVRAVEYPNQIGALNGREDRENYINGFSFGYGAQYFKALNDRVALVIGYNGSIGSDLNSRTDLLSVRTPSSVSDGTENLPIDTIAFFEGQDEVIAMPMRHRAGFTLNHTNRWMIGADFSYDQWSDFRHGNVDQGLQDSYGVAVGGQITPDPTSVRYLGVVDYRLGFRYNKTYIQLNNEDINEMAITVGLGLPLPSMFGFSFNKVNFSAELGQRGTTSNQLVRDRFVNFSLGFTLNDTWFRRAQYD